MQAMQKVCGIICAISHAKQQRENREKQSKTEENRKTKAKLDKLKSKSQWAKEAQTVVNKYVRVRDAAFGCVSCDKPASWAGQWHASHFRSVGAAPGLRFNLWNIHKACSVCNNHLSGNLASFTPRLIEKIGADRVEWLRNQNAVIRRDVEYFERVKYIFTKKIKRLLLA